MQQHNTTVFLLSQQIMNITPIKISNKNEIKVSSIFDQNNKLEVTNILFLFIINEAEKLKETINIC